MTGTLRRFQDLRIHINHLCERGRLNLLRILSIHGGYIKKLKWQFDKLVILTAQETFEALNKTPNLRDLTVYGFRSFLLDDKWPEDASLSALTKLKTVDLRNVPKGFGRILTSLPANTLTALKVTEELNELGDTLLQQSSSLVELTISEKCLDPHIFRCLKIEKLFYLVSDDHVAPTLNPAENRFIVDVVRNQPLLKHLFFCTHSVMFNTGGNVFETTFELSQAIFGLSQLETLELGPTKHSIQGISRLHNLKSLSLQDSGDLIWNNTDLHELSRVKFPNLERLDLFCCETLFLESFFENLGRSNPNLKRLLATNDEVVNLNSFFNNFPNLEHLEVGCFKDYFHWYNYDGKAHVHLKTLILMTELDNGFLLPLSPSMFEALPRLNRIYIAHPVRYDIAVLRALSESRIKRFSVHFEHSEPQLIYTSEKEIIKKMSEKAQELDITIEKQSFLYN